MNRSNPEFDQRIADWLEADPFAAPGDLLSTVVAALPSIPQDRRRPGAPWRLTYMTNFSRAAAGVAILAIVGVGVLALNVRPPGSGSTGSPTPTLTVPPSAAATPTPTVAPSPSRAIGATHTSDVYGFSIGLPEGWRVVASAQRRWDAEIDARTGFASPGVDTFSNATGTVAVSAWQVPIEADIDLESRQDLLTFAEDFCRETENLPCTGIPERAVQMCRERADCHAAVIVPFDADVLAFSGGTEDGSVNVVAVWWGDSAPAVAEYGGSIALLKTILSSMNIWTPQPGQVSLE